MTTRKKKTAEKKEVAETKEVEKREEAAEKKEKSAHKENSTPNKKADPNQMVVANKVAGPNQIITTNKVAGPNQEVAPDTVQEFVALATHVVDRAQPGLFEPNNQPQTVAALIEGAMAASWPARVRLAAFVSELPSATTRALSDQDLEVLALAPRRLGCSQPLLSAIREYNALAPTYTRLMLAYLQEQGDQGSGGSDVFRLMDAVQERLYGAPANHIGPVDTNNQHVPRGVTPNSLSYISGLTYHPTAGHFPDDNPVIDVYLNPTIAQGFGSTSWLLNPSRWSTCITQVTSVADATGTPPPGSTWMFEHINLTAPVSIGVGEVVCLLQVTIGPLKTKNKLRSQKMTYSLVPGGSALLDRNDGSITIFELPPRNGGSSLVVLEKHIHFKTASLWQTTFNATQDGLTGLLNYWVIDAENTCTPL